MTPLGLVILILVLSVLLGGGWYGHRGGYLVGPNLYVGGGVGLAVLVAVLLLLLFRS